MRVAEVCVWIAVVCVVGAMWCVGGTEAQEDLEYDAVCTCTCCDKSVRGECLKAENRTFAVPSCELEQCSKRICFSRFPLCDETTSRVTVQCEERDSLFQRIVVFTLIIVVSILLLLKLVDTLVPAWNLGRLWEADVKKTLYAPNSRLEEETRNRSAQELRQRPTSIN